MNKLLKQELNSILTRERIINSLDSVDDRTALIATLRNFKEKNDLTNLPVTKRQRGLTKFLKGMDKLISKVDYNPEDDLIFKMDITTYLDASEGAGMASVPEEEKEEAVDPLKKLQLKRQESEKRLESTIDEIGEMAGDDDESPLTTPPTTPTTTPTPTPPPSPLPQPPPRPANMPPPPRPQPAQVVAPTAQVAPPPPSPKEALIEPEEKPIEDISTEQVIEIPSERKGTDGKSIKQLNADIKFFLSKYPSLLKEESAFYSKMKKTKRNLVELHRRCEAKLAPLEKKDPKTIGIIVDADSYIDARIKALLVEKTMAGLKPEDMVIDVTEPEDKSIMRKGSYVLSKGRSGRLAIERSPVYRNIPTTNPQPRPRPYQDVSMLKSQRWDLANNAKKHVLSDPFIKPQPKQRINLLL